MTIYNGYFFLSLAGILVGGLHLCLRYSQRSRCRIIKCCDCIEIIKEDEKQEDAAPMNNCRSTSPSCLSGSTII